ncbi:hypothetical protein HBB16_20195 [Pseudonocardia sp. MCCB 268]|nr:hypothetical protein [Pseudonocardia cytotoxica]
MSLTVLVTQRRPDLRALEPEFFPTNRAGGRPGRLGRPHQWSPAMVGHGIFSSDLIESDMVTRSPSASSSSSSGRVRGDPGLHQRAFL